MPTTVLHTLTSRRPLVAFLAIVAALTATAAILVAVRTPTYALPAMLELGPESGPAQPWLDATIASLRTRPTNPRDPRRPVTHTHLQEWSMETTNPTTPIMVRDIHHWWAGDMSARSYDREISESAAAAARYAPPPTDGLEAYPPGQFTLSPLPADPDPAPAAILAAIEASEPLSNGPYVVLRGVFVASRMHKFTSEQTVGLLIALRDHVPGLVSRGKATDRAGRTGTVLAVESGTPATPAHTVDMLIIDDAGRVLSYEMLALYPPGDAVGLAVPAVVAYSLILGVEHVPAMP